MRVLHVIDPGTPGGGACTLQLLSEPLARLTSVEQDVLILGTERHESLARRCGVEPTGRISPPWNEPLLAGFGGDSFKRFVRMYERASGPYDIIHTWTARSTLLAAISLPGHRRIATLAVGPVNGLLMQVLANRLRHRPCAMLATSVSVKRDYLAMGLDEQMIDVLAPAVHPEAVEESAASRETLRTRWGVDEDTFVVGLLAEPMSWADARRAIGAITIGIESGRRMRLLVHPTAQRRMEALQWLARIGVPEAMIVEDDLAEPWTCVHGLDAALFVGDDTTTMDLRESGSPFSLLLGGGRKIRPMTGVMPALWAMGMGVPVVAESGLAMQEILREGETGFLFPQRSMNDAASRLVHLYDDRAAARRIGGAARSHIARKYHVSAYAVRLKKAYQNALDGRLARIISENEVQQRPRHSIRA